MYILDMDRKNNLSIEFLDFAQGQVERSETKTEMNLEENKQSIRSEALVADT